MAGLQRPEMADHEVGIEGVRVVVVEPGALFIRQVVMPLIIVVVAKDADVVPKPVDERLDQRRLAAAGAARDSNYDHICHIPWFSFFI